MSTATAFSLDVITVKNPCTASWHEMSGNDRVRFCSHCWKHVYNISEMTRDEAETLITHSEGRLCVRLYRRADGTIVSRQCGRAWRAARRGITVFFGLASALALMLFPERVMKLCNVEPLKTLIEWIDPPATAQMGDCG